MVKTVYPEQTEYVCYPDHPSACCGLIMQHSAPTLKKLREIMKEKDITTGYTITKYVKTIIQRKEFKYN